jgi:hypothetical protein
MNAIVQRFLPLLLAGVIFAPVTLVKSSVLAGPITDAEVLSALPLLVYFLPMLAAGKFFGDTSYSSTFSPTDKRKLQVLVIGMAVIPVSWGLLTLWAVPIAAAGRLEFIAAYAFSIYELFRVTRALRSSEQLRRFVMTDLYAPLCAGLLLMLGSMTLKAEYALNGIAVFFILRTAIHAVWPVSSATD